MLVNKVFDAKYRQLNTKQREAVDTIYGPVMVVAGPGTGKTTVLTLRIANILAKTDAKPEEILALTFTDNGARNMREKLRLIIGDASFRVNIFTFHSFANHMRGLFPENFAKIGERLPSGEAEKFGIIEEIFSKQSFRELRVSRYGVSIGKIARRISDLKRELVFPKDLAKLIAKEEKSLEKKERDKKEKYFIRIKEFAKAFELYEKELEKRAVFDYDDAILELIDALKKNKDMASEMRESFQFVLADEHQDANGAQNEILKIFKAEGVEKPNVFVVGDDKQSIFRFQGASLEHFYNFSQEFKGAKKISLSENYRSHKIILDAGHSLISRDGNPHQKLFPNVSHKEKKIEIVEYPKYETELFDTARKTKEILNKRGKRETIAIIARNNKVLFDIAPYLEAEKVEFTIAGERSLFGDFHYQKLIYLFEALANPYDGALLKALYAGYFKADIAEVIALALKAKKERRDFAVLFLKEEGGGKINPVRNLQISNGVKELISKAKRMPVLEFLREIKSEIEQNRSSLQYNALRAVFDEASELTKRNRAATLDDLLSHLRFLKKHDLAPLASGTEVKANVELLSIHRAKGLEYDCVFVIDAVAKRFEGSGRRGDLLRIPGIGNDTELDEERRLLYVALTRTKHHASISYSLSGDEGSNTAPSALLSEIDSSFIDKKAYSGKTPKADLLSYSGAGKENKQIFRQTFLLRNFSVSALNNFIECPWKYFFRNLLLVPEPAEFAASLGNACHNALRIFHTSAKKGKEFSKKELKTLINQCISAEPFSKSELPVALERAEKSIFAYTDSFAQFTPNEKISVEDKQSFVYKLKEGKDNFEITITGKIDLSREKDGKVQVIDFKTKKRMTRNEIAGMTKGSDGNEMRQLQFYKFLLEIAKKDCEVSLGTLTFLSPERGKILSETFELTPNDSAEIEKTLKDALLSIYHFDFRDKNCGEKDCGYCALSKSLSG